MRPAPPSRRKGFAIVLSLAVMALMVLVVLSLAAFLRVESMGAVARQSAAAARLNALAAVRLGEAAVTVIPPGASRATLPPVAPGAPFAARLDLGSGPEGREVRPFLRATWVRAPRGRLLSFVVADPDRAAPRILSVPDSDEPAPAGPPPPKVPANGRR